MKFYRAIFFLLTIFIIQGQAKCMGSNGEVILSYLYNNRLSVLLKGTYATNNPLDWSDINGNKIWRDSDDTSYTDSECSISETCVPSYDNLGIYIDFGGVRISSSNSSLSGISDADDFWTHLSTERQVYCSEYSTINQDFDSCRLNSGLGKYEQLMNGEGALYPTYDIPDGSYLHTGVYVRALVTSWARVSGALASTNVDNITRSGANIVNLVSVPSLTTDANMPPEWFPMHYRVATGQQLIQRSNYYPAVLEIRFNIKENLMLHSYTSSTDSSVRDVVAFSDWRVNHDHDGYVNDTAEDKTNYTSLLGGNVLSRSRIFYPHLVSNIKVANSSVDTTKQAYYAIYGASEEQDADSADMTLNRRNNLPYVATPARPTSTDSEHNLLKHIMPGEYVLECRLDDNEDGYPEKFMRMTNITISESATPAVIDATLACP